MYENISNAVAQLDAYAKSLNLLQAMSVAIKGGATGYLSVDGITNNVPLPGALVQAGIDSETTRITQVGSVLKAKLDQVSIDIGP